MIWVVFKEGDKETEREKDDVETPSVSLSMISSLSFTKLECKFKEPCQSIQINIEYRKLLEP